MDGEFRILPATVDHAELLAATMREEDRAEVEAAHGVKPLEALLVSLRTSSEAWTLLRGGEVLAMGGVAPVGDTLLTRDVRGQVWLLSGTGVERNRKAFLRATRELLGKLLEEYPELVNAVDARYDRALRWVKWLGFEVGDPQPLGKEGALFCPVRIRR